ncbi:multidrug effflux MFS transporter [Muricoccus radiodurans]|uniref:multidrug effflux MFS transporter n=1 Tax=Muricoccus radiodurans TaxID=2231721 RepID=UPI003CF3A4E6
MLHCSRSGDMRPMNLHRRTRGVGSGTEQTADPVSRGDGPKPPHVPLPLLAAITFSATLGMHVFVPALPLAARDLGTSAGAMQMTVSVYVLGLAFGQLVYGPISDRFGRRPVLMAGLTLFTLAGLGAALAPDAWALIAARLLQALGGCAGMVLARAIIRDIAGPKDAARRLALMNLMVTVGPGLAPLVGNAVAHAAGWRPVLLLLCGLGIVNLLLTWRLLPETGRTGGVDTAVLIRNYGRLLRSPAFLGYSIGGGCATTAMYAFIASAPFILVDELRRPPDEVGIILAVLISGVWLGSVLASRLVTRAPLDRLLVQGSLVSLVGSLGLLAAVLTGHLSVAIVIGTMFLYTLGGGVSAPVALTQAVSVNPQAIGSASGLYGFTQMAVGAICTALAGLGGDPALAAALVMAGAGIIGQAGYRIALRWRTAA